VIEPDGASAADVHRHLPVQVQRQALARRVRGHDNDFGADRALQVHGALGMTGDTPIAFWYREERAARLYDGPDEVHEISVAKRILRGYGVGAPR